MSIHVTLNAEAQSRLAAQRRTSTITSGVISLLVIIAIGLVLGLIFLPSIENKTAVLVTYTGTEKPKDDIQEKKVKVSFQRKPSSPAYSSVRVIASSSASALSIPVPDEVGPVEAVEFGDGEEFGGGWGEGDSISPSGDATFFDQKVKAERIAYVIDYSQSMKGEREKLMRTELSKSIKGLGPSTKYQLIFFSGPAWVAGDEVTIEKDGEEGTGVATSPSGDTFKWIGAGAHEWRTRGTKREIPWIDTVESAKTDSLRVIESTPLAWGTDWESPLEMAMAMDPPPQLIFFMTDGAMKGKSMMSLTRTLAAKAKRNGTVINSIAMMQPDVAEPMAELAFKTGGRFTIVESGGVTRELMPEK